jgi:glutathionyl-hydroquinone reductase
LIKEEFKDVNFVPAELREKIEEMNSWIYVSQVLKQAQILKYLAD